MAQEVALLLGAVVIVAAEGAAAVGREDDVVLPPLGEAVPVAAVNGLEIVFLEAFQQGAGVLRPADHQRAERKVVNTIMGFFLSSLARLWSSQLSVGRWMVVPGVSLASVVSTAK